MITIVLLFLSFWVLGTVWRFERVHLQRGVLLGIVSFVLSGYHDTSEQGVKRSGPTCASRALKKEKKKRAEKLDLSVHLEEYSIQSSW